jgi:Ca-activated chloride channel family protein
LAQKGNGNFYYVDNEREAEKILVTELTQTLYSVADNVKLSLSFRSPPIREYRLIGYNNKRVAMEDSSSRLEGGEIGSGHSIIALFELIPFYDSLKGDLPVGDLRINYQLPGKAEIQSLNYTCPNNYIPFSESDSDLRKAASVAMFGMKLRDTKYGEQISWKDIENITFNTFSAGDYISDDYLDLVDKAIKVYGHKNPKHKKR